MLMAAAMLAGWCQQQPPSPGQDYRRGTAQFDDNRGVPGRDTSPLHLDSTARVAEQGRSRSCVCLIRLACNQSCPAKTTPAVALTSLRQTNPDWAALPLR